VEAGADGIMNWDMITAVAAIIGTIAIVVSLL
jgi:hypothetical protein